MITMSLQTKLGEKVSILVDRVMELWNGKTEKKKPVKNGNVKVSQPISGQVAISQPMGGYTDGTAISSLPTYDNAQSVQTQQLPNYDAMYRQDTTPLVGAATPGMSEGMMPMEPAPANLALGGGSFGSW